VYLALILITLCILIYLRWHATLLARYSKRWWSCTHSACVQFSFPINMDHLFVMLLLELSSMNHTEVPSHINAAFYRIRYRIGQSVRENCLNFRRDLLVSLLLAIYFLSNSCEKSLNVVRQVRIICASYRTHQLGVSFTARFKQILIRLNNKIVTIKRVITRRLGERAFHTRWY